MNNYYKIYLARCVIAMKGWSREAGEGGGGGEKGGGGNDGLHNFQNISLFTNKTFPLYITH